MTAAVVSPERTREQFRTEHNVRLIRPEEEGDGFNRLPPGVYGFTYAPATETPVFERRSYHSFEVHKLADGAGRLIGCCSSEDAEKLRDARASSFEMILFPESWEQATTLVSIPLDWVAASLYKPVRRDGNGVPLHLSVP